LCILRFQFQILFQRYQKEKAPSRKLIELVLINQLKLKFMKKIFLKAFLVTTPKMLRKSITVIRTAQPKFYI